MRYCRIFSCDTSTARTVDGGHGGKICSGKSQWYNATFARSTVGEVTGMVELMDHMGQCCARSLLVIKVG